MRYGLLKVAAMAAALAIGFASIATAQAPTTASAATDIKTEMGEIDGAVFRIDVPTNWNHGLVIMNHGYSPEPRKPLPGPPSARIKTFTDRGYAVAASSYSKGGWAIEQAMQDNEKLRKYFVKKYGKTTSVFATGGAMGASTTMTSVELYPDVYTGGLITCCGTMLQPLESMQGSFRMMVLFDYYFPHVLPSPVGPLNGFMYGGDTDKKVQAALDADPKKAEIFRRTTGRRMEHLANHVTFQTYINHEYQQRAGGNPFDNSTYIYTLDDDPAVVNAGVKRYFADPKAMEYAKKWYASKGDLKKPLMIMSPVYDPVVTINNTTGYIDVVRDAGHIDKIAMQWFDHEGHGALSEPEVAAAFDALIAWTKGGPKPPTGHGVNQGTARGAMGIGAPGAPRPTAAAGAGQ
jgi:hypothetical protein